MRLAHLSGILAVCVCAASSTRAQDSVGATPGTGDALSAHGEQRVRYVVDSVPFQSSWGNEYLIAPIAKASEDVDPGFNTNRLAASVASADVRTLISTGPQTYLKWNAPGEGVHPTRNAPPSTGPVWASSFDRLYIAAFNDLGVTQTNVTGLTIGYRLTNPLQLFITRTVAATSRSAPLNTDHSTVSLGGVDAEGNVLMRVDDFTSNPVNMQRAVGESIVRVRLPDRDEQTTNTISRQDSMSNQASDDGATSFIINAGTTSTSPPTLMPASKGSDSQPKPLLLNFAGRFIIDDNAPSTEHLSAGLGAHRGNPSYTSAGAFAGADGGTVGFLGRSLAGGGRIDSIGITALDTDGAIIDTARATLPMSISEGGFTANDPAFFHHQNQTIFRGGNGPVALGLNEGGDFLAAATARAGGDEFIAVATFMGTTATWSIAAYPNKPVLDGSGGQQIGRIASASEIGSPVAMSSPAMDLLGNVYFVGAYKPTLGSPTVALFKAAKTQSGYSIERLLTKGQIFVGANSTRPYEIISLALGDSNSLSSGALSSGSIIQQRHPGSSADPLSPLAMGALFVNAVIRYDNNSIAEDYDAVLYISGRPDMILLGDIDGDGTVNALDLAELIGLWGTNDPVADLDSNGVVGASDLAILIGSWTN